MLAKSSIYLLDESKNKGRLSARTKSIILYSFVGLCLLPSIVGMGFLSFQIIGLAKAAGMEKILIGLFLTSVSAVTLVLGFYHTIIVFFFGKDNESLIYLPLKPNEILTARFLTVLIFELATQLFFLLTPMIVYGIRSGSFLYWLYAVLVYVLFPVTPLVLSCTVGLLVMPLLNRLKNKDMATTIMSLVIIISVFVVSLLSGKVQSSVMDSPQAFAELLNKGDMSVLGVMARIIPSVRFAALALADSATLSGLINVFVFILVNVAFFVVFLFLGKTLYFQGVIGLSQVTAGKAFSESALTAQKASARSPVRQYVFKEVRVLMRTPAYFMNCITVNILVPIMIVLPGIVYGNADLFNQINSFIAGMDTSLYIGNMISFGFVAGMVLASLNSIAATAISRDGGDFRFCKYIPMPIKAQILSKILPAVIIGLVNSTLIIILTALFIQLPVLPVILVWLSSAAGVLCQSFAGILFDLTMPKLNWSNETAAVKQNFNTVFCIFSTAAAGALIVVLQLFVNSRFNTVISAVIMTVVIFTLVLVSYMLVLTYGVRRFEDIEN